MSNQEFINSIVSGAQKGFQKYGILPSVTIAQAINESGWGQSYLARTDNNLFGIKFPGNHSSDLQISQGTWATDDGGYYAHYSSWSDSVEDHGFFLKNNSRYAAAIGLKDPSAQVKAIADAGYATESDYYSITMQILNENNLTQYDSGSYSGANSANSKSDSITIESTNYQVVANSEKERDSLFGRRYRITVSDENGDALDVSQLRCTFNIAKTIQMEPNSSEVCIYNLSAKTENHIMMNGKRVTVEAGYEGSQFGLIFDGDILQTIREREDGTTFKLTIIALDSDRAINFDIANFSIAKGQTARSIVDHIVNKAKNPVNMGSISEQLEGQTLPRGKVLFGKSSDYLRQIAKGNKLHYYMDDGSLNLISLDELPKDEIFELSPKSGLIGTPEQSDYGISGKCLLNPQIKLNSLIHVDNSLVRAKRINISGSNSAPGGSASSGSASASTVRNKIIEEAKKLCDDPNVQYSQELRGQTVDGVTYYDCSSFAQHCYSVAGLEINPTSETQWGQVQAKGMYNIEIGSALPGDLVFWFNGDDAHHVALYGGNNDLYAARGRNGIAAADQVEYQKIYGDYKIGRPECMVKADGGEFPSANNNKSSDSNDASQTLFRCLDKDGIYRVIKLTYEGDTRGDSWYVNFETIDQLGGAIPTVSN